MGAGGCTLFSVLACAHALECEDEANERRLGVVETFARDSARAGARDNEEGEDMEGAEDSEFNDIS